MVPTLTLLAGLLMVAPRASRAGKPDHPGNPCGDTKHAAKCEVTRGTDPRSKPTSDTVVAKSDKVKPERVVPQVPSANTRKKALKPHVDTPPVEPTPPGRQAPDRPWETTFLVSNTMAPTVWRLQYTAGLHDYR